MFATCVPQHNDYNVIFQPHYLHTCVSYCIRGGGYVGEDERADESPGTPYASFHQIYNFHWWVGRWGFLEQGHSTINSCQSQEVKSDRANMNIL